MNIYANRDHDCIVFQISNAEIITIYLNTFKMMPNLKLYFEGTFLILYITFDTFVMEIGVNHVDLVDLFQKSFIQAFPLLSKMNITHL